ncbi:hypothetical protein [Fluviispira sanaruensis]|uniref:Uncharacterized protein n=1 Tax=Fluviispira sanaruensis TaxID=2493639 RepID=A0A4V0P2K2_FLUSA|nr:hypothetical protein [Fluviispira sanaruensis]BBH53517.1 hypothetical protein JCM31447_19610 [Fluviispira sanaruensis]
MQFFFLFIFSFILFHFSSFAGDICIKNNEGIFCGEKIQVNSNKTNIFNECVEFKNKKICGKSCMKSLWGADCKQSKYETCISNFNGVICGFDCKEHFGIAVCASKPQYKCKIKFNKANCGIKCQYKYGEIQCEENDKNLKILR